MPKYIRSLSTKKLVCEIFYITFKCFPFMILNDRVDIILLQVPLANLFNMSLRNTIHYMERRGSSGQGSLFENDFF